MRKGTDGRNSILNKFILIDVMLILFTILLLATSFKALLLFVGIAIVLHAISNIIKGAIIGRQNRLN